MGDVTEEEFIKAVVQNNADKIGRILRGENGRYWQRHSNELICKGINIAHENGFTALWKLLLDTFHDCSRLPQVDEEFLKI